MKRKPYSAEKGAALIQAKRLVLHRFELGEDEWLNLMTETGCLFVEKFSSMFPNPEEIKRMVLQSQPAGNEHSNAFWSWWQFKWLLDDESIIKSPAYYEHVSYTQLKSAMVGDDLLECQLLQSLQTILQL